MKVELFNNILTPILITNEEKKIYFSNISFNKIFSTISDTEDIKLNNILDKFIDGKNDKLIDESFSWTNSDKANPHYFDLEVSRIFISNFKKSYILILFKDITPYYLMTEKTVKRSEELSILYEISLAESKIRNHNEIIKIVCKKIIYLTKFDFGMFFYHDFQENLGVGINYNFPEEIFEDFLKIVSENEFPLEFRVSAEPTILKTNAIKPYTVLFEPIIRLNPKEIIIVPVGNFGVFIFSSYNPYELRITEEKRFFTLLAQELEHSLQRANLYFQLRMSYDELENKNNTLNRQLELSQSIQNEIMTLKKNEKLKIDYCVKYIASEYLSGDLYDIWNVSDNVICVLIADVCGHGVSSALVTSFIKATIREIVHIDFSAARVLEELNKRLMDILPLDTFVSAFVVLIDIEKNQLEYSTAGHPGQFYYNSINNKLEITYSKGGTLLSVLEDSIFYNETQKYDKGDKLILFTDGIYEIRDKNNEIYGRKSFHNFVSNNIKLNKEELLDKIINNAYLINKSENLEDDVNIIIIDL